MTSEPPLGVGDNLLESAAGCLDAVSIKALENLKLDEGTQSRPDLLAHKANEGTLTDEESREYDRVIELGDILATLRLKAHRQMAAR